MVPLKQLCQTSVTANLRGSCMQLSLFHMGWWSPGAAALSVKQTGGRMLAFQLQCPKQYAPLQVHFLLDGLAVAVGS